MAMERRFAGDALPLLSLVPGASPGALLTPNVACKPFRCFCTERSKSGPTQGTVSEPADTVPKFTKVMRTQDA